MTILRPPSGPGPWASALLMAAAALVVWVFAQVDGTQATQIGRGVLLVFAVPPGLVGAAIWHRRRVRFQRGW